MMNVPATGILSAFACEVFKRREFARWQAREGLTDVALCRAVREIECGLVDAALGGLLFKKRIARPGGGKRGGYRTILSARTGRRYVFLHGFAKNETDDISAREGEALRFAGRVFLDLDGPALEKALAAGVLQEVWCEEAQDRRRAS